MKITWVTRSFLDYRLPVYKALDKLSGGNLTLIYNKDKVPERCHVRVQKILGDRAIALEKEKWIRSKSIYYGQMANKGFSFSYHPDLIKTVRTTNPDVLISDGYLQWTYAPLFIRLFNRKHIKHVMCYERTKHTERNAGFVRTLYRKIAGKLIDAIDCNGRLTAEYITDNLNYKKPIGYGHMVADTDGIAERVENANPAEVNKIREKYGVSGPLLIYVGNLIPRKGIMELLQGWKDAELSDVTLMLVGDGLQRNEVEKYIADNDLKNVVLMGAINYDDLGPYYKAADCFIIPTLEDNWSLVVPEAMAAGLPVACSIYNGCHPELVHPKNGWTFDPLNVKNTTEVLKQISASRDKLKEMGDASKRIVANHTPQHAAQNLYDLCEKVLSKK